MGTLAGSLIIVSLSLLGVCGEVVDIRNYGRGNVESRYCLGFNHANNVHCMYWYLISLGILIWREHIKCIYCLILILFNCVLYIFTRSRTGFLTSGVVIILALAANYIHTEWIGRLYGALAFALLIVCCSLSVWAASVLPYYDKYLSVNNRILTGRLEMVWEYAPMSSWMVFPPSRMAEFVDNGFVSLIYTYGVLIGVLFVISVIYLIICGIMRRYAVLLLLSIGCILVAFTEATYVLNVSILCNIFYCSLLILQISEINKTHNMQE